MSMNDSLAMVASAGSPLPIRVLKADLSTPGLQDCIYNEARVSRRPDISPTWYKAGMRG